MTPAAAAAAANNNNIKLSVSDVVVCIKLNKRYYFRSEPVTGTTYFCSLLWEMNN